jgi:hypothetical protein
MLQSAPVAFARHNAGDLANQTDDRVNITLSWFGVNETTGGIAGDTVVRVGSVVLEGSASRGPAANVTVRLPTRHAAEVRAVLEEQLVRGGVLPSEYVLTDGADWVELRLEGPCRGDQDAACVDTLDVNLRASVASLALRLSAAN